MGIAIPPLLEITSRHSSLDLFYVSSSLVVFNESSEFGPNGHRVRQKQWCCRTRTDLPITRGATPS